MIEGPPGSCHPEGGGGHLHQEQVTKIQPTTDRSIRAGPGGVKASKDLQKLEN